MTDLEGLTVEEVLERVVMPLASQLAEQALRGTQDFSIALAALTVAARTISQFAEQARPADVALIHEQAEMLADTAHIAVVVTRGEPGSGPSVRPLRLDKPEGSS